MKNCFVLLNHRPQEHMKVRKWDGCTSNRFRYERSNKDRHTKEGKSWTILPMQQREKGEQQVRMLRLQEKPADLLDLMKKVLHQSENITDLTLIFFQMMKAFMLFQEHH